MKTIKSINLIDGKTIENIDVIATLEALEGEIGGVMEILGSYVDGINLLNARIFALELKLKWVTNY